MHHHWEERSDENRGIRLAMMSQAGAERSEAQLPQFRLCTKEALLGAFRAVKA